MSLWTKIRERRQLLDEIIKDLKDLKSRGNFENQYAIDENINKVYEIKFQSVGY